MQQISDFLFHLKNRLFNIDYQHTTDYSSKKCQGQMTWLKFLEQPFIWKTVGAGWEVGKESTSLFDKPNTDTKTNAENCRQIFLSCDNAKQNQCKIKAKRFP